MPANSHSPPAPRKRRGSTVKRSAPGVVRTRVFKFRCTPEEEAAIIARSRGYPTPAAYARRMLVAGSAPPLHRINEVTAAFIPIQEAIDLARAGGGARQADAATDGLRRILLAVAER